MSFEAGIPGEKHTWEAWQMICCRYYTAAKFITGKQVLEVGCGAGRGLGYFSARAQRAIGGDYSQDNLRYAKEHYKERAELLVLDAHQLPFRDSSFDVVVAMEVIYYLAHLDDFLKECHRVLRKGGNLCLCLPNQDVPGFHASLLSYQYYSVPELSSRLKRHDFEANIFGAFPVFRKRAWERVRATTILNVGRTLDKMPKGKAVRDFLSQIIIGRSIVAKAELEDSDMLAENCNLEPLLLDSLDNKYRILYAIAHTQ